MHVSHPVANVSAGWKRSPALMAEGSAGSGITAALWTHADNNVQEVSAQPNQQIYSVGVAMASFRNQTRVDNQMIFAGQVSHGFCNIVRPGESPQGIFEGQWKMLHVYLPAALLQNIVDREELGGQQSFEIINPRWTHDPKIARIADEIVDEMTHQLPLARLKIDLLGQNLAIHLLRDHSSLASSEKISRLMQRGGLAPWQIRRSCDAMDALLHKDISLTMLANTVGLSPAHFSRSFKQSLGVSPFEWLRQRRIQKAMQMLALTDLPLADIASATGFSAQTHFTTSFRRAAGMSPGLWRKSHSVK